MRDFLYLVQGKAKNVPNFFHLCKRDNADAIFLTWDGALDGAEFFPDSTWTQGRNRLLALALKREPYSYYIFCDDDVAFIEGSWDSFEASLLKFRPAIGTPVTPKIARAKKIPLVECQAYVMSDEQLIAFHRNAVLDRIVLPYQEKFDQLTIYAACEIQEVLTRNFYAGRAIIFNNIKIENLIHEGNADTAYDFRSDLWRWLRTQFRNNFKIKDVWLKYRETFLYECFYTCIFYMNYIFSSNDFRVPGRKRRKVLRKTSIFLDESLF